MSPIPQEQIGAVPQQQAMQGPAISKEEINNLRKDPQIIKAVQMATGRSFPMEQIDDSLIVQIAAIVHKLGVEGAVAAFKKTMPPDKQALIRGIAMKGQTPMAGPGGA